MSNSYSSEISDEYAEYPEMSQDKRKSREHDLKAVKKTFIEQLRLRNFRSYADACLRFEDFTVLIGQNGAGKSTLREALEIMRDALTDSLSNAL